MFTVEHTKCIVCGEEDTKIISILDHSICHKCEQEIIHTNVDEPMYSFFLDKIKLTTMKK